MTITNLLMKNHLDACIEKMLLAGQSQLAINAFCQNYQQLLSKESTKIIEANIQPVSTIKTIRNLPQATNTNLLNHTAILKLNGGLGTSMQLNQAKSLIPVKQDLTFLDIIIKQYQVIKNKTNTEPCLFLLNSFATHDECLAYQATKYKAENITHLLQSSTPKINAITYQPEMYFSDPKLEWCPPGHGDLFVVLQQNNLMNELINKKIYYLFVANADNLGAIVDLNLLNHLATTKIAMLMEVVRRTNTDRKGGHLAMRKTDNKLILRELAQCDKNELDHFQNIQRYQFFNTNNIWFNLIELKKVLDQYNGILPLPLIKNSKLINPIDLSSTPILQLENAMGAIIEYLPTDIILVTRNRFIPVKNTFDLIKLRSDNYQLKEDFSICNIENTVNQ